MDPTSSSTQHWAGKFFTIWTGQVFSIIGSAIVQFALVWWLTDQTGSATVLATASLVALLPQIISGPFVGALVDRWNRRLIMIFADSIIALATGVLIYLFASGIVQVWHIYVILSIRSLGGAFHSPAMTASTSLMVPHQHLARVSGLNQLLQGIVNILTPPLGALLISLYPTQYVLAIDVVTAALAVLPLFFIAVPQPKSSQAPEGENAKPTSYWQDLVSGFGYVKRWPGLLSVILLAMLLNFLLAPSSSLLPLLIKNEFQGGAPELAWTDAVFGVGVILGGLILSAWGGFKRRMATSLMGVAGIGTGVILAGLAPSSMFWLLVGAFFILGVFQVLANGPLMAIMQSTVDADYQGRIFSLLNAGAGAMMPLSLLVAGPISDAFGVRIWFVIGGGVCILASVAATSFPPIMNIEQNRKAAIDGAAGS